MASSDNRPGFRLPWQNGNASGSQADSPAATAVVEAPAWPSHDLARRQNGTKGAEPTQDPTPAAETTPTTKAAAAVAAKAAGSTETMPADAPEAATVDTATDVSDTATPPVREIVTELRARKPTKFLADLTRAMRQAADEARTSALAQFQADVERHSESARDACGNAASDARRRADDDITTLGEWETQQIARIRRETEDGITARHERLEAELADQTLRLETELARVRERVEGFEAEVQAFFQRLLGEDDPAQFAAMAEQLPEPPAFEPWSAETGQPPAPLALAIWTDEAAAGWTADGELRSEPEATVATDETTAETTAEATAVPSAVPSAETTDEATAVPSAESSANAAAGTMPEMLPDDFAAAEAEAAEWTATEDASPDATDAVEATDAAEATDAVEASDNSPTAASTDGATDADKTGPWPPTAGGKAAATTSNRTEVAVVGLVSVASIANFKRLLSRVQGVRGVQVASGPDGEFLFTAAHDDTVDMRSAVGGIQGFQVEVVDSGPGVVSARTVDPEAA